MKKQKGVVWFFIILILGVLMVNPPILPLVNQYCTAHPMTFGWPTLFLWLEFWYIVMIADFLVSAIKLKAWDCSQDSREIKPVKRG